MKPVLMSWAMSAMFAICVAPRFGDLTPRPSAPSPVVLAQSSDPLAVPGSADMQAPDAADDNGDLSGQTTSDGQTPEGADPAQEPPVDTQPFPTDDTSDDAYDQQPSENGEASPRPSPGDDE